MWFFWQTNKWKMYLYMYQLGILHSFNCLLPRLDRFVTSFCQRVWSISRFSLYERLKFAKGYIYEIIRIHPIPPFATWQFSKFCIWHSDVASVLLFSRDSQGNGLSSPFASLKELIFGPWSSLLWHLLGAVDEIVKLLSRLSDTPRLKVHPRQTKAPEYLMDRPILWMKFRK